MRRKREERLQYLLTDKSLYFKPPSKLKFIKWFTRGFGERPFAVAVREQPLDFSVNGICLEDVPIFRCRVQNGLDYLQQRPDRLSEDVPEAFKRSCLIASVNPIDPPIARSLQLPNKHKSAIKEAVLALSLNARSCEVRLGWPRIHTVASLPKPRQAINITKRLILSNPTIRSLMPRVTKYPHCRKSVDISALPVAERDGFLREAEVLKGIDIDNCELLAVFRRVPIELISQLRFLSETRMILYTISNRPVRTRTRVHDLAVICDMSKQEIHFVPNRTQYRLVFLN
jgi:hypothetical protein